ncbi:MAG: phytanoyl-CoA dioxygenase family protein [Caldimonas sp.]
MNAALETAVLHLAAAVDAPTCARWRDAAERSIADACECNGPDGSASSASLRLCDVAGFDADEILKTLWRDPLRSACEARLGLRLLCDLDRCWLRRQYAPGNRPGGQHPHSWHQDGALGFDFVAHPASPWPAHALAEMLTCWIALVPCGVDAPGLELARRGCNGLLAPADLEEAQVRARFDSIDLMRPALADGDALLFASDVLHRTHVLPSMTRDRISLELRIFPSDRIAGRLAADRFSPLPGDARRSGS